MRDQRRCKARIFALVGFAGAVILFFGAPRLSAQVVYPNWSYTGSLNIRREGHSSTLLQNGKVLVAGGWDGTAVTRSAELYDPATGTWRMTGSLNAARGYFTATLLQNGKVLVAGGSANNLLSTELYDPATETWSPTGNLNQAAYVQSATLLNNGKVLVIGYSNTPELYDPATGLWRNTAILNYSFPYAVTATLLTNGKVLVAGGDSFGGCGFPINSAELFDPATETWRDTGSLNTGREGHAALLLQNGKVLVAGGYDSTYIDNNSAEIYDPNTETWTLTGNLNTGHIFNAATLLPNGKVLVWGGDNVTGRSAELYDPASATWGTTADLNTSRTGPSILLPNGKVLVAGGSGDTSAELYDPRISAIDEAQFFVHQHYVDFLNREPDAGGLAYWTNRITECGSDSRCIHDRRIGVSAAFFIELEFQDTGYFVYRFYKASFGRQPNYMEFITDRARVIAGSNLEVSKQAFADEWVQRPVFLAAYPSLMSNTEVVNRFFEMAGLTASIYDGQRQQEIQAMNAGRNRALVLRDIIEISDFKNVPGPQNVGVSQFNPAFVLMQYFGYLRRDIDQGGYAFWLDVINNREPNNYRAMVCAFLTSSEYQLRFGSNITRSNQDCGH